MELLFVFIGVLIVCFLILFIFQRMKASKKRQAAYVCTTCGEMDCICHKEDHTAGG